MSEVISDVKPITLPKEVGEGTESLVVMWYKEVGDSFEEGETLVEVQTDKAIFEVPAPFAGVITEILVDRGEVAAIGQVMAYATEALDAVVQQVAGPSAAAFSQPAPQEKPATETGHEHAGSVLATPKAKKIAREHGLDIALIKGSGVNGKITEEDVLAWLEKQAGQPSKENTGQAYEEVKNSLTRKATARHMLRSLQEAAQLTLTRWAEVTELQQNRKQYMPEASWNDWVLRAVVLALKQHPEMNATWVSEELRHVYRQVNLGVAVDTTQGLMVPVIARADTLSFPELCQASKQKQQQAQANQLKAEDMQGGTFTVSNLGGAGILFFTPVLHQPQVGILGVGKLDSHLTLQDEKLVQEWRLPLSLTFDHRAIDGAPAAAFLQTIAHLLASPQQLL